MDHGVGFKCKVCNEEYFDHDISHEEIPDHEVPNENGDYLIICDECN